MNLHSFFLGVYKRDLRFSCMRPEQEKRYVKRLIQDMRVRARDMEDFMEERKYKRIISKFEKGMREEYNERD